MPLYLKQVQIQQTLAQPQPRDQCLFAATGNGEFDLNRDFWLEYTVPSAFDLRIVLGLPPIDRVNLDEPQLVLELMRRVQFHHASRGARFRRSIGDMITADAYVTGYPHEGRHGVELVEADKQLGEKRWQRRISCWLVGWLFGV